MGNAIRPEDILPNGDDVATINGKVVRKGTVAAFLANLAVLENVESSEAQKNAAMGEMEKLAPDVVAIGLSKYVTFKNEFAEALLQKSAVHHNNVG